MLLNHNDTLDAVFTLAHEMGHNMHTVLAHAHQPFVYSDYTIFVAEVPSTLNEALLLDYLLAESRDPRERVVLLEHAIENIAGTFFSQVLFADYELRAHRLVEPDQPITAEILSDLYAELLRDYYGDAFDDEPLARLTWARVPHFYQSPYYVYQYATCFASAARLADEILGGDAGDAGQGRRSLPRPAEVGRQRPSDGAAAPGWRGSRRARHGAGGDSALRQPRGAARAGTGLARRAAGGRGRRAG